jgi:predicted phosphoribosyltransferase
MIFDDRYQAGELLAKKLSKLRLDPQKTVIFAIPRGGIIVGWAISQLLKIPLTCIVIKKLGAPTNSELAIGATAAFGKPVLDRWLIGDLKISPAYLKGEIVKKRKEAQLREKFLGCKISATQFKSKNIIVCDDGLATGQTARAAVRIIKTFSPKKVILAVPCGSPSVVTSMKEEYDKVICLAERVDFWAVGQFYNDFRPIEDEEVLGILKSKN